MAALQSACRRPDDIPGFKNVYSDPAHMPTFNGLQHYGEGGTSVTKSLKKTGQNEKKQLKIMREARHVAHDRLG